MFIPLVSDSIEIINKDDTLEFKGNFGLGFKHNLRRIVSLNEDKLKALFIDYGLWTIKFNTFFIPEVIGIFNKFKTTAKYRYKVNVKALDEVIQYLENFTKNNADFSLDYKRIEEVFDFKIMTHQQPIFDRYELFKQKFNYRGMLLDAGPGTGKTFSSLALAEGVDAEKVVIICPLSTVTDVWEASIGGKVGCVYKKPQDYYKISSNKPYNGEKFIIVHYEGLEKCYDLYKTRPDLRKFKTTVIVDESHNLASSISKRTLLAIDLVNYIDAHDVFCLSGTPLKSSFKELGVIFKLLDKRFQGKVEDRFYKLYKSPNDFLSELLTSRYRGISVRVEKDSIELQPVVTNYVNIKLKDGDKFTLENISKELRAFISKREKELEEIKEENEKDFWMLLEKGIAASNGKITYMEQTKYLFQLDKVRGAGRGGVFLVPDELKACNAFEARVAEYLTPQERKMWKDIKTIYKYPYLKIQGEALGLIITGARINCHAALAGALNYPDIVNSTTKKTLIFSSYVNVCREAEKKLKSQGYASIGVYGETVGELNTQVNKFNTVKKLNPLVTTYKSLSTGVRLTTANVVICLDLPFRMYTYDQAISRVWRLGQDQQVFVYILSLDTGDKPNINSRNIDIITFFKEEIEKITGYKAGIDLDKNVASVEDFNFYQFGSLRIPKTNTKNYQIFEIW